jgi:hypothetical protein
MALAHRRPLADLALLVMCYAVNGILRVVSMFCFWRGSGKGEPMFVVGVPSRPESRQGGIFDGSFWRFWMTTYDIDPPAEPTQEFLNAWSLAGRAMEAQFRQWRGRAEPPMDFKWIQAELLWPAFSHLIFAYRNKVFAVLVDVVRGGNSSLSAREIDRCVGAAREHDLQPCAFRVDASTMLPAASGWNLTSLLDGRSIDPLSFSDGTPALMSEWELQNFANQVVRGHIAQSLKGRIVSCCNVLGIDPQIWFEGPSGRRSWVVVRHVRRPSETDKTSFLGFERKNARLLPFDGYFASVSAASAAAVLRDPAGDVIPLSKRHDGSAPLYRGDGFHVRFQGLERIHVA